ncbi:hypothetical protein Y032_0317g2310 [Ancylostoma ceylanicum]|uniref:Uncharacterized protein n=1 Tax=Ancylostoma ceylanicum TaxID=53326 RepID=A0A016S138_9BILA|nr:hypothetical protein Y032_0317g2310 [Ancylostoma ceylanicum]
MRHQACFSYKAVTVGKDDDAMDKYVKNDGSVEVGQFLSILRRQLEEARKLQVSLTNDLRAERELLRTSKKKEADLKNFVKALERELRDVRNATNMGCSTPFNPKLRGLALDQSPSKRNSLGFNDSIELNVDVISSALKQRRKYVRLTFICQFCCCLLFHRMFLQYFPFSFYNNFPYQIPPPENPGPSGVNQPLFPVLSDDEDTGTSSTANVSLQYPASLDNMFGDKPVVLFRVLIINFTLFSPSPRVPKTLRERVVKGSLKGRPPRSGSAHHAAEKALENLELGSGSTTSMLMRKPLAKRRMENSSINPALSHFFIKKSKSTEVIDLLE